MIQDFLSSWSLFHNAYLSGWLIAALLAILGVIVVARDQIFIGAALAQSSTLGIAAGVVGGSHVSKYRAPWVTGDGGLTGIAVLFSVIAAIAATRASGPRHESRESIMGWLFLLGAAGSILIVSHSPQGLDEVHRLLSSSLIGATGSDVAMFALLLAACAFGVAMTRGTLLLWIMDPATAAAAGVRIDLVETSIAAGLGGAIGLSIRASGMLYAFGCLVLPAAIAKSLCREVRQMFIVAPVVAVLTAVIGFILANHYDFPPAQMTVTLLCCLLPVGWVIRHRRAA